MSSFAKLLEMEAGGTPPWEIQSKAGEQFPKAVNSSPLNLWKPGQTVALSGIRILVGVAARYSHRDLRLLDALCDSIGNGKIRGVIIDVFDTTDVLNKDDFQSYIPGLTEVLQTPVVGVWVDGRIQRFGTGLEAIRILEKAAGTSLQV